MIDPLNEILRDLIQSQVSRLAGPTQVGFEPPDEEWGNGVVTASEERLNLYLYDLRENLKLRSNERRLQHNADSTLTEKLLPAPLDCFYLLTVLSGNTIGSQPEKSPGCGLGVLANEVFGYVKISVESAT